MRLFLYPDDSTREPPPTLFPDPAKKLVPTGSQQIKSLNPMGTLEARVVRGGKFGYRTQSVTPVRTPVLLLARRELRPLDYYQRWY